MGLSNAYFNIPIASIQKNKRTSYIFTNECFREYIQTECYRDSFFTHLKFVFKKKCLGLIIQKHFPLNYKARNLCISVFYEQFEIYHRGNSNDRQDTNNERQN